MAHPSYDWSQDWRGYASREERDADIEADRHDQFLSKLAEDEYWHKVRGAKAIFDLDCGVAVDKFGHGSREHCSAIDTATAKFDALIKEYQIAKRARVKELRANDEVHEFAQAAE